MSFLSGSGVVKPHVSSESSSEFVEQLGPVGLPHDLNIQSLFDPTGTAVPTLLDAPPDAQTPSV